jgi:hypothetical protein
MNDEFIYNNLITVTIVHFNACSPELEKHMKERRNAHHVTDDGQDTDVSVGSFKKQLDYLLTLSERSQLKRALEEYIRSK